jgi:hypothetical protein
MSLDVQSQQLLPKGKVLEEEFSSRAKGGDKPAEQMSKAHKHQVIIAKSAQRVRLEVIDSADVQSFGEAQEPACWRTAGQRPLVSQAVRKTREVTHSSSRSGFRTMPLRSSLRLHQWPFNWRIFQTLALPRCHRVKGNGILLNVLTFALRATDVALVVFTKGEN